MPASRPAWTVLLLMREQVVRVDFDARRSLQAAPVRLAVSADTLLDGLEHAVHQGGGLGERVVLSSEACWTQTLFLRSATVDGLEPELLKKALAFEAESSSGIAALESVIGWHSLAGCSAEQRGFRITQVAESERTRARELLHAHGARLATLLHPAGTGLSPSTQAGTADVEIWDRTTLLRAPNRPEHVLTSEVGRPGWRAAFDKWIKENEIERARVFASRPELTQRAHDALGELEVAVLAQHDDGDQLLSTVAERSLPLGRRRGPQPPSPPIDCSEVRARGLVTWGLCAAVTLGVLTLCVLDWRALAALVDQLESERARTTAHQEDITHLRKSVLELRLAVAEQRVKLPQRELELEDAERLNADLRGRYATLLRGLNELARPGIVLSQLGPDSAGRVVLEGVGLTPAGIESYAADLGESLAPPWRCAPATTGRLGESEAWGFRLRLGSEGSGAPGAGG